MTNSSKVIVRSPVFRSRLNESTSGGKLSGVNVDTCLADPLGIPIEGREDEEMSDTRPELTCKYVSDLELANVDDIFNILPSVTESLIVTTIPFPPVTKLSVRGYMLDAVI